MPDRIVATVAEPSVKPEPSGLTRDVGLGHVLQRGVYRKAVPLDAGLGRKVGQGAKGRDEVGPAIGIA